MGLAVYILATVAVAVSPTVTLLIWWRVAQGEGAGAGMVLARAVVADRVHGTAAAKLMSLMMAVGVAVLQFGSWRWIFGAGVLISLLLVVAVLRWLRETRDPGAAGPRGGGAAREGRTWGPGVGRRQRLRVRRDVLADLGRPVPLPVPVRLLRRRLRVTRRGHLAGHGRGDHLRHPGHGHHRPIRPADTAPLGRPPAERPAGRRSDGGAGARGRRAGAPVARGGRARDAPGGPGLRVPHGAGRGLRADGPGAASAVIGVVQAVFGTAMPPIIGRGGAAPSGVIAISLVVASAMALVMFALGIGARRAAELRVTALAG